MLFTSASQPHPVASPGNPHLLTDLQDVAIAYKVNRIVNDEREMINLLLSDVAVDGLKPQLDKDMKVCEGLRNQPVGNDTLKRYLESYLAAVISNYQALRDHGIKSPGFKQNYADFKIRRDKYMNYLASAYSLGRFVHLTESQYWKTMDKKNYIHSPQYAVYTTQQKTDRKKAMPIIETLSASTTDFQEAAIYSIEAADQYVKHDSLWEDASKKAIGRYKAIIDKQQYCLYLFEAWVKWRAVSQQTHGLSKSSDIPNDEYDRQREQVAATILGYIRQHETDEMAINQFLVITTHDIIKRFGDYPYGNQSTVEYHEIFD